MDPNLPFLGAMASGWVGWKSAVPDLPRANAAYAPRAAVYTRTELSGSEGLFLDSGTRWPLSHEEPLAGIADLAACRRPNYNLAITCKIAKLTHGQRTKRDAVGKASAA